MSLVFPGSADAARYREPEQEPHDAATDGGAVTDDGPTPLVVSKSEVITNVPGQKSKEQTVSDHSEVTQPTATVEQQTPAAHSSDGSPALIPDALHQLRTSAGLLNIDSTQAAEQPSPGSGPAGELPGHEKPVQMAPAVKAQTGWRGLLNQLGLSLDASNAELEAVAEQERLDDHKRAVRTAGWSTSLRVLVANRRGGVGKTVTSLTVGAVMAMERGGQVSVVEISEEAGGLAARCDPVPQVGVERLSSLTASGRVSPAQVAACSVVLDSRVRVYATVDPFRPVMDGDTTQAVLSAASWVDSLVIADTGNQYTSESFRAGLAGTDAVIIPVTAGVDALAGAKDLLAFLGKKRPEILPSVIVVLLDDGRAGMCHTEVLQVLKQAGVGRERVFAVPFDAHLAERGPVTFDLLSEGAKRAWLAVGAQLAAVLAGRALTTALETTTITDSSQSHNEQTLSRPVPG